MTVDGKKGRAEPVDVLVGARLRQRRMELDMSQETLANGVGLTFQQIQKYEKGTNRISCSRLVQFATIMETPILYFFGGDNGHKAPDPVTDRLSVEVGMIMMNLSSRSRTLLIQMARVLKEQKE